MPLDLLQWLLATALLLTLAWHERPSPWPPLRIFGALLYLASFAPVTRAR